MKGLMMYYYPYQMVNSDEDNEIKAGLDKMGITLDEMPEEMWARIGEQMKPTVDGMLDSMGEDYMDVLADGAWEKTFTEKPEVFTKEEKRAWLDQMTDVTLGSKLDGAFPKILTMLFVLFAWWLMAKKNITPIKVLLLFVVIGFVGSVVGFLG